MFYIHRLQFDFPCSLFTVQYSVFNVQVQCSMFKAQIQRSLFKCSKLMSKFRVQRFMSWFSLQCSMRVFGCHNCMSDVHVSIDFQCLILISVVSQCSLPGSLVHEVTPDDDQVLCTNCSLQLPRYSC